MEYNKKDLVPDTIKDVDSFLDLLQDSIDLALKFPTSTHSGGISKTFNDSTTISLFFFCCFFFFFFLFFFRVFLLRREVSESDSELDEQDFFFLIFHSRKFRLRLTYHNFVITDITLIYYF